MNNNTRQLSAIMFTDMVGYTALMQEDENRAISNRKRQEKVLKDSISRHHGTILQFYGDGTLSIFSSAIEAIECSVAIQQELQQEPVIPLRIGLHVGDIVYSDDGIYGDAVNVASRIENLAVPGGVFISDKVFDEIKNHHEFKSLALGEFRLKNVKQPINIHAIANKGLRIPDNDELDNYGSKSAVKTQDEKQIPILATKLFIPPLKPGLVHRSRLIEKLNLGLNKKLTLVSAQAGFGKTTLVSHWINDQKRPAAWLSMDEGHNDLTRFLIYLVAALQKISSEIGSGSLSIIKSPQGAQTELVLTALLNEIAAVSDNFIIVLDDYHVIDNSAVDDALSFLLDHLPPQMHLVIATREDPHLPLSRLRVRGQLNELRAADLRFSQTEAAEFLSKSIGFELSADDVSALETKTEGWIAGLQLAALSMKSPKDVDSFIKSFTGSHRFVLDYLLEEVLNRQDDQIQDFLLFTSILNRMCGPLCESLLKSSAGSGQTTLETLEQANMFIIPLDGERRWYRYHHLFADLLRQRLPQRLSAQGENEISLEDIHRRAGIWYEKNGFNAEAIHYAVEGKDFERAAKIIELAWAEMDISFQAATWLNWVQKLPDEFIINRPMLCIGYAWALLDTGQLEAVEPRLQDAENWLKSIDSDGKHPAPAKEMIVHDNAEFEFFKAQVLAARAFLFQILGDIENTIKYSNQAMDFIPDEHFHQRAGAKGILGLAYWSKGDLEKAYTIFEDSKSDLRNAGNELIAECMNIGLAFIRSEQGKFNEAIGIHNNSLKVIDKLGDAAQLVKASVYLGLSVQHLEQGDLEQAEQFLWQSEENGKKSALPDWLYRWHIAKAAILEVKGDFQSALEMLNKAEEYFYRNPMPDIRPLEALRARLWIKQNDFTKAMNWAKAFTASSNSKSEYMKEFEQITLARLHLARFIKNNDKKLAVELTELLDRQLKLAQKHNRVTSAVEALVLGSLLLKEQDDNDQALKLLMQALTLAEKQNYQKIFMDEGKPIIDMIKELNVQGSCLEFCDNLFHNFNSLQRMKSEETSTQKTSSPQQLIEPLSERELEILQLIAQGFSNNEICRKLFLALSTVKGHNQNIFSKLGVQRRTEAAARARELGLLQ